MPHTTAAPAAPMTSTAPVVPTVVAVVPARGGSKGVSAKNLATVGGVPLVARAVRECRAGRLVTDVVVSTDDDAIAEAALGAGAVVVRRPDDIAGDTATSEAAVLHAMDAYEARSGARVDAVLLVQCTSPFLVREDIDGVAAAVVEGGADSALTVAPFHGFVWRDAVDDAGPAPAGPPAPRRERAPSVAVEPVVVEPAAGVAGSGSVAAGGSAAATSGNAGAAGPSAVAGGYGVNHDKSFRPRRQDRPQDLLETGAAYAMDAAGFRRAGHRFFGRTELVRTDPARVLEVDDPHDLARARALAPLLDGPSAAAALPDRAFATASAVSSASAASCAHLPTRADIDAVVMDFDGTQTDDRVLIDSEGREIVAVHRGDGLGIAALRRADLRMLILSTEVNPVVAARARKLRLPVLHGIDRKDLALKEWCEAQGIAPERVLYVGNDVNDLPCFGLVGWPVAVAGAHDHVRDAARVVTTAAGGHGAIREIAAWILGPSLDPSRGRLPDPPMDSPTDPPYGPSPGPSLDPSLDPPLGPSPGSPPGPSR